MVGWIRWVRDRLEVRFVRDCLEAEVKVVGKGLFRW